MDIQSLAQSLSTGLLKSLDQPSWVKDAGNRYLAVNAAFLDMCGFQTGGGAFSEHDVLDVTDYNLFPLDMAEHGWAEDRKVLAGGGVTRTDFVLFNSANQARRYEVLRSALRDEAGAVIGTLGYATDVTERAARLTRLRDNERTLSAVIAHMPVVAYERKMDDDWSMRFISDGCRTLSGYAASDFLNNAVRTWASIISGEDFVTAWHDVQHQLAESNRYSVEYRIELSDGQSRWVSERGVGIHPDGTVIDPANPTASMTLYGIIMDFTETRHYLDEMVHRDTHDTLTGVANRPLLVDHLRHGIAYAERYKRMAATIVVNIDHFKYVNQSLGHDAGDELLKGIAGRLRGALRDHDTVARLGADSFAMTLIDLEAIGGATQAMTRVLSSVREPFMLGAQEVVVTCSVGCALFPNDGPDPETLLRRADSAMRHARSLGGDCYYFYSAESDRVTEERFYMEAQLRRAVDNGELLVFYQPQVDARDGRLTGLEALVRWKHPEMGLVSPGRFIPLAEETDLIVGMGAWIMEQACRQTRQLIDEGLPIGHVAVNLSARQFRDNDLLARVGDALDRTGLHPRHLELEITESLAMNNVDAVVAKLRDLKSLGLQMAIDDFGTGYSSLSYLRRFPIDRLKIDQSFTREVAKSSDGAAIARAVIELGHALDLRVIAEGVETVEQLAFLRDNECDEIQGYYFSRPLDFESLRKLLLESRQTEPYTVIYIRPAPPPEKPAAKK